MHWIWRSQERSGMFSEWVVDCGLCCHALGRESEAETPCLRYTQQIPFKIKASASWQTDSKMQLRNISAAAKSLQSCPTLCDPIDSSLPGSSIPGILQARTLEWVAISFSNAWKWRVKVKSLSRVRLLANPWTAAYQAPPPMGFSRQEYWSGVLLPSPWWGAATL